MKKDRISDCNNKECQEKNHNFNKKYISNNGICECKDNHNDKKEIVQMVATAVILLIGIIAPLFVKITSNVKLIVFLAAYILIGKNIVKKTIEGIKEKKFFNENLLMVIASAGAFLIGEYPEGVAVMLFYRIGEFLEEKATQKSRKSITSLMDIRPDFAWVKRGESFQKVSPEKVNVRDIIQVRPGERVPLDGIIVKGNSTLDQNQLTGETIPTDVLEGEEIFSGAVNLSGVLEIEVIKEYGESTACKILEMVEKATQKKTNSEKFITRFAKYYTPSVVIVAALVAIIPSIVTGNFKEWIYRGLTFLVVSCPCALVISIPLSFFAGLGAASKNGILVKGSNYLELLSKVNTFVFDKTGTLTKGKFFVKKVVPTKFINADELLRIAAYTEKYSPHPIGRSIVQAYGNDIDQKLIKNRKEIPGKGIEAFLEFENSNIYIGNKAFMEEIGVSKADILTIIGDANEIGTMVHLSREKEYLGYIVVGDEIKDEAKKTIEKLSLLGVNKKIMLSGDSKNNSKVIANELSVDECYGELLPQDKVELVENYIRTKNGKDVVAFVGDGMNDAPVLARADIGIAMGALGSDSAIEAADIVIMDDNLTNIPTVIKIAKRTLRIVKENIVFAIGVKVLVILFAGIGVADMWLAVFADVGIMIVAVLNAMRALFYKENR